MTHLIKLLLLGFVALMSPVWGRAVLEQRALPPALDPFYRPPTGYESKKPGTILRQRTVIAAFLGLIPDPVETHQLLYRTTAIDGSAIATVTTIFKPVNAKSDRFLSFHTAYDSSASICNPSYNYQFGSLLTNAITSAEQLIIQAYLASGYIVASPDYEGPDAAFSPGRLSGTGVLDGMRAVKNFQKTLGFTTENPNIVGVGYSGGAIATGWAASLQPTYAPELALKGWVQGGTPANLTGTLVFIDGTTFSGFLPPAVVGLTAPSAYGAELQPLIKSIITPKGQEALAFAAQNCDVADLIAFSNKSILNTEFQTLGYDLLYEPRVKAVLGQNLMGAYKNETPTAPVLVYHASGDEIIPYANASTLVNSWCANGASVQFNTFPVGEHLTTEVFGLPDAIKFVSAAFAGTVASGCSAKTMTQDTWDNSALGPDMQPIASKLGALLDAYGEDARNVRSHLSVLNQTVV